MNERTEINVVDLISWKVDDIYIDNNTYTILIVTTNGDIYPIIYQDLQLKFTAELGKNKHSFLNIV